ncbi:leucyl aminopeptidase [Candidatus Magnetobacterium casense]|uniref:Probable cytosol aminopeptidase n=1 Tax=Candidatus Magnetobacterium casense TaxID=1455061 RepID=A0ABS6S1E3_9BACT|nr:leucyl aminopeptidase [Candidatus Magnetobacterium casensis]MBV6342228.1 leucyl aminopeptidase [Candidatus Magnetobacterium casensis]
MEIKISSETEDSVMAEVLVLPFFEGDRADFYAGIDERTGGLIKRVFDTRAFSGKHGQTTLLYVNNINTQGLLLVGLGKLSELSQDKLRRSGGKAFSALKGKGISSVTVATSVLKADGVALNAHFRAAHYFLEGVLLSQYQFKRYKTPTDDDANDKEIVEVVVLASPDDVSVQWLEVVVSAVGFAKDLTNTPANDMTPTQLSNAALALRSEDVTVKVLELNEIEQEGMGSYLAVARGSAEPPKFIILEYLRGTGEPVAIVGKSVTFDSGGLSLKPADGMEQMKYDMAGGAATLGIIKGAAQYKLPVNIVAVLPATENMPGGKATRPGDIVKAITGKTIEILNTDAEGRLALADALGYVIKHYKPKEVIDMATLTGACSVAFGNEAIAMMGNNDDLMDRLKKASAETYERVWQMPLYEEYKEYLKSDTADIKNIGGREGGLMTSAYFLKEFVGDTPWVHLDIAATAWNNKDKDYAPKGASGIGVRLLLHFLKMLVSVFIVLGCMFTPVFATDANDLKQEMLQNPDILNIVMSLKNDQDFQQVLNDPEIIRAINANDISALSANPKFTKLMEHPKVKEIETKLKK